MGLFTKKIGPVFLKENSDAEAYIEKLKVLKEKAQGRYLLSNYPKPASFKCVKGLWTKIKDKYHSENTF